MRREFGTKRENGVLLAGSKPDGVTAEIIDCEILPEENITDDPELATWEVDVHASKRANALVSEVEDIVGAGNWVRLATEHKGEIGHLWDLVARNSVLSVPRTSGTDPIMKQSVYVESRKDMD